MSIDYLNGLMVRSPGVAKLDDSKLFMSCGQCRDWSHLKTQGCRICY